MRFVARLIFSSFLEEGERIVLIFRRPLVLLFIKLKWRVIIWGGLAVGLWFLDLYDQDWIWMTAMIWAVYRIFAAFMAWYTRAILMTNESLVFVYWPRFFYRRSDRIDWCNLDEIQVERDGMKAFALNYGTLRFQKANGTDPIEEKGIARPNKVARQVEHFRELMMDEKNFMEESALKELLSQMVMGHVDRHGQPQRPEESKFRTMQERVFGKKPDTEEAKAPPAPSPQPKLTKRTMVDSHFEIEKELDDTGGIELDL